ncbi:MAG: DUF2690 domain-containing protein [Firmicutes bacterium]|uniref:DUF2690 domain-containing protein n=1 Tax=Melghirimyces thermohalophilus TaxID=1236220 RepID=A0A1G6HPP8_9BACL|nr:DUF2690 domain-containing protein [Melghirimyces thermohalophilus]MDA8353902.1 DUF2690 domain-containing protein [Bacillota bacterium]SDB96212.1 Protein of unknown function [Melghirimyces thermohalophilus]
MKRIFTFSLFFVTVFSLSFFAFHSETYAWSESYTGTWPHQTPCASDARTVHSAQIDSASVIELRYSPSCETAWARITADYPHEPSERGLGEARIVRNSDGRSYSCTLQAGQSSCFTQQVNDHNVTSFAEGVHDNGIVFREARTASY